MFGFFALVLICFTIARGQLLYLFRLFCHDRMIMFCSRLALRYLQSRVISFGQLRLELSMLDLLGYCLDFLFFFNDLIGLRATVILCLPLVFREVVHVPLVMLSLVRDDVLSVHILHIVKVTMLAFCRYLVIVFHVLNLDLVFDLDLILNIVSIAMVMLSFF